MELQSLPHAKRPTQRYSYPLEFCLWEVDDRCDRRVVVNKSDSVYINKSLNFKWVFIQALFVDNFYNHHARWFWDLNFIVHMYIMSQSSLSTCMGSLSNWDHWNCLLLVTVILLVLVNLQQLAELRFFICLTRKENHVSRWNKEI